MWYVIVIYAIYVWLKATKLLDDANLAVGDGVDADGRERTYITI